MRTPIIRTLTFLILLSAAASLVGCDSFTDIEPKGTLAGDQLQTPAGAEALVRAAYAGLTYDLSFEGGAFPLTFFNPPSNWSFSDVRSDDAYKGGGGTGDIIEIHLMEINSGLAPTNFVLDRKWTAAFQGIQRASEAILAVQGIEDESFPTTQRVAEMRFLRGHYYFDLKKTYNRVPWIDETVSTEEIREISNTALMSEELWNNIQADFQFAADNLPDVADEPGRADRLAAEAYLAKVALFREQWDQVIQHTDAVIGSGQFGLLDRYDDLSRVEAFDNSIEDVFSIQYSVNDGSTFGNVNWGDLLNMPQTDACGGGGDGFLRPSQNLVNAYRVGADGLPLFDTFNNQDVSPTNPAGDDTPVDPRLDLVVTRSGIPWKGFEDTPEGQASANPIPNDTWYRQLEVYGRYARKKLIVPPDSPFQVDGFPWCASSLNFPLIRYAEVLLWKAEALVESGQNLEEARQLVNQIRERAANQDAWVLNADESDFAANYQIGLYPASGWSQDVARRAVRFESRLETALEGHRFFNLVRWGNAGEVLTEYFVEEVDDAGYYASAVFQEGTHEYVPIPQNQIDISEGLYEQNPGY